MPDGFITSTDDVLAMLDKLLAAHGAEFRDEVSADPAKSIPFFTDQPDESLAGWLAEGSLSSGRALELGCGNGRNTTYLASLGCRVDAVDFSAQAIAWTRQRAQAAGVSVNLRCSSIFDARIPEQTYDLVYDSGCFHHIAPHRRPEYVELVGRVLKPGGHFGLTCFRPEGGSGLSDQQVYQRASLGGGLGYTEHQLRALFGTGPLTVLELRQMRAVAEDEPLFGLDFLWVMLSTKPA